MTVETVVSTIWVLVYVVETVSPLLRTTVVVPAAKLKLLLPVGSTTLMFVSVQLAGIGVSVTVYVPSKNGPNVWLLPPVRLNDMYVLFGPGQRKGTGAGVV